MPLLRLPGICLCLLICLSVSNVGADEFQLETIEVDADALPEELREAVAPRGHRLTGEDGPVADIWFARGVSALEGFQPSLNVKYPLTSGQFIGVLRVVEDAEMTDFRDQELDDDQLYLLRYGQQPADGNHIGTSETFDFLLATPADDDEAPTVIDSVDKLHELSSAAAGTSHPAIFSLLPVQDAHPAETTLTHDSGREFWILQTTIGEQKLPLRLIVVGVSEG